ncbi:ribosome maturation factor RimP [Rhodococcoides corynebacterioides]|uniref:ribosome maturation factor RimP n=1 Tax=Rhodococcoides corynebacterioides TaxID=53972 RepID=UPI001C9AAF84|nr:ribosome maturation factor RimP [Rhodococcus corynebacterioides]MBY6350234.1 ribosome maturation factor RimP [Rhodococcus corynebacterioides]
MPVPSRDRVVELISAHAANPGFAEGEFDVEEVSVSKAGSRSVVKVVVDRDAGFELDVLAAISRQISGVLDAATEFGDSPYTLEVTTPGVDRPLTEPRHWRRARGRAVTVTIGDEAVDGRVGESRPESGEIDLVIKSRSGPQVRTIRSADIRSAVVRVEFSPPNPAELALAGGVTPGRYDPLDPPDEPTDLDVDDDADSDSGADFDDAASDFPTDQSSESRHQ